MYIFMISVVLVIIGVIISYIFIKDFRNAGKQLGEKMKELDKKITTNSEKFNYIDKNAKNIIKDLHSINIKNNENKYSNIISEKIKDIEEYVITKDNNSYFSQDRIVKHGVVNTDNISYIPNIMNFSSDRPIVPFSYMKNSDEITKIKELEKKTKHVKFEYENFSDEYLNEDPNIIEVKDISQPQTVNIVQPFVEKKLKVQQHEVSEEICQNNENEKTEVQQIKIVEALQNAETKKLMSQNVDHEKSEASKLSNDVDESVKNEILQANIVGDEDESEEEEIELLEIEKYTLEELIDIAKDNNVPTEISAGNESITLSKTELYDKLVLYFEN